MKITHLSHYDSMKYIHFKNRYRCYLIIISLRFFKCSSLEEEVILISKSRGREKANSKDGDKSTKEVGGNNKEEVMAGDNKEEEEMGGDSKEEEMGGDSKEEEDGDSKEGEDGVGKVIMVGAKEWVSWGVKIIGEIIRLDTIG